MSNAGNEVVASERDVQIRATDTWLTGDLAVPHRPRGLVAFAHGSGSTRRSPRNRVVSRVLQSNGFATLLFDLLTPDEAAIDAMTSEYRFDIERLSRRATGTTDWAKRQAELRALPLAWFGASTGAAAALGAAAERPDRVAAVISRGGRPDLAGRMLERVTAPTLLIVGGLDGPVIEMNRMARARMKSAYVQLEIVPEASHLFEEPGKLEHVAELAVRWLQERLVGAATDPGAPESR